MSFIEKLWQTKEEEKARRQKSLTEEQVKKEGAAAKKAKEEEFRDQRRKLAETFREESRVAEIMKKLGGFFSFPAIEVKGESFYDGIFTPYTKYVGTGGYDGPTFYPNITSLHPIDPNSVFDLVRWDKQSRGYGKGTEKFREKYVAAETTPTGLIAFHGSWAGINALEPRQWRSSKREAFFDNALERAYKNPGTNNFEVFRPKSQIGMG